MRTFKIKKPKIRIPNIKIKNSILRWLAGFALVLVAGLTLSLIAGITSYWTGLILEPAHLRIIGYPYGYSINKTFEICLFGFTFWIFGGIVGGLVVGIYKLSKLTGDRFFNRVATEATGAANLPR